MLTGLNHIAIICSEKERSLQFYETLGFQIQEHYVRPERQDEIYMLKGAGVILELFIDAKHPLRVTNPEAMGLRHAAFTVTDVENFCIFLKSKGYNPEPIRLDSFNHRKMTFVKDPDGLPIELHE